MNRTGRVILSVLVLLAVGLMPVACNNRGPEPNFDVTGLWTEQSGGSTLEFTETGAYILEFAPPLSDGTTRFEGESYNRIDNSHLSFTILMGAHPLEIIEVEATINSSNVLRFRLDGKTYRFTQSLSNMPAQAKQGEKAKNINNGNKVIITGKLIKKDGSPVTYGRVEVNEWIEEGNKFRIKIGEGGIYLNPNCKVDDEGRFTLELDLDVFEGAEAFAILACLSPDPFAQESPLRNRNGNLIVFEFSEGAKNLDLGQIVVE